MVSNVAAKDFGDDAGTSTPSGPARERPPSDPCLPARLPTSGFIQREASQVAPKSLEAELERIRKALEIPPAPTLQEAEKSAPSSPTASPKAKRKSFLEALPSAFAAAKMLRTASQSKGNHAWKAPEPYEIMRAIERRDIMFIMEVRDRSFESLIVKSGDVTPLIHAMRIEHTDMAIILLGAFSRYINNLQDEDVEKPETKKFLKMLRKRFNLKTAIDYGLQKQQKDLIASFLQTLIMSEGDSWVKLQTADVAVALREGTAGKPVHTAADAVRSFATKSLGQAHFIASLEDYVANATADLVMMAAWSSALQFIQGEPLPSYYFARDDRVYRALVERLDKHNDAIQSKVGRRLRWQLRVLRTQLEGRARTYRSKVESLAKELDEGEGI
ncbi:uncharacterized protein TRAVEDRAFT_117826 [Trametes versicolor FP-101664 SS1]|uniref:uncharacterized protein n=1 Tax=Trametes versicolor (strain FP-101664) TaxID=717944 RepID=UPI0004622D22|nr:uncharacterized protein TRAVEDRAFT_117826 [Trametes versicolor FP-101664 SS1]EIW61747.1 hypothetical protein TRAVEDRAFT_117826 [Trametes versicolor FP-101664 SS1]